MGVNYWIVSQLLYLQGGRCPVCKKSLAGTKFHTHHIDGKGDDNSLENLMVVHPRCHRKLHGAEQEPLEGTEIDPFCPTCEKAKMLLHESFRDALHRIEQLCDMIDKGIDPGWDVISFSRLPVRELAELYGLDFRKIEEGVRKLIGKFDKKPQKSAADQITP